ncbi:MAG: class I SAM-dependent methyltransferase [Magnetococcales bacterium]|nr:class I SAM-dependent methyltransferase [Magnetococcales bacterium]
MKCRHCDAALSLPLVDLGSAPPSNAYLTGETLHQPEWWYPLRVLVCETCWLVQTEDFAHARSLFSAEYAYFSGFSSIWLDHCARYVADMVARFALDGSSHVVELAANDGSLLQYVRTRGIPCTGVEPTASTAAVAKARGLTIIEAFFGMDLAREMVAQGGQADLIVANNVLAHVPGINDFVAGCALLLKPGGVVTFEFPHLLNLLRFNQFDTIYHEHFSYLSLISVQRILDRNGLSLFDVEEHPTHGGSLRVFAQRRDRGCRPLCDRVEALLRRETAAGMASPRGYAGLQSGSERIKNDLLTFLLTARGEHRRVMAYGAAAKGNTLLNFAGVRSDLVACVADRNPAKQGKYLPGSRIPIVGDGRIGEMRPDYVLILPWNLREEVMTQLAFVGEWGGRFVTAVPCLTVV